MRSERPAQTSTGRDARPGCGRDGHNTKGLEAPAICRPLASDGELKIPRDRLNVNGGAIALGHPIGNTGARIITTLTHAMKQRKAKRGLATLCVSGGLGAAVSITRG
ncbi:MAG: hypothetical protein H6839_13815 [Planctomycetes bacterium]|nr:hypothetical protein [Planctomycetota bacterium]